MGRVSELGFLGIEGVGQKGKGISFSSNRKSGLYCCPPSASFSLC